MERRAKEGREGKCMQVPRHGRKPLFRTIGTLLGGVDDHASPSRKKKVKRAYIVWLAAPWPLQEYLCDKRRAIGIKRILTILRKSFSPHIRSDFRHDAQLGATVRQSESAKGMYASPPPRPGHLRQGSPETSRCSREPGAGRRWRGDRGSSQFCSGRGVQGDWRSKAE